MLGVFKLHVDAAHTAAEGQVTVTFCDQGFVLTLSTIGGNRAVDSTAHVQTPFIAARICSNDMCRIRRIPSS